MKILRVLIFIFYSAFLVNAQSAVLSGIIYDQQGAVIPNAEVSLKDKKGKNFQVKTNEFGVYKIEIPTGLYSIEINANLFETFKIKKFRVVSVLDKSQMNLDVSLIGKANEDKF